MITISKATSISKATVTSTSSGWNERGRRRDELEIYFLFPSHIVANYGQQKIKTKSYLTLTSIYLHKTPINKSSRLQFPLGSFLLYYIFFYYIFIAGQNMFNFFHTTKLGWNVFFRGKSKTPSSLHDFLFW